MEFYVLPLSYRSSSTHQTPLDLSIYTNISRPGNRIRPRANPPIVSTLRYSINSLFQTTLYEIMAALTGPGRVLAAQVRLDAAIAHNRAAADVAPISEFRGLFDPHSLVLQGAVTNDTAAKILEFFFDFHTRSSKADVFYGERLQEQLQIHANVSLRQFTVSVPGVAASNGAAVGQASVGLELDAQMCKAFARAWRWRIVHEEERRGTIDPFEHEIYPEITDDRLRASLRLRVLWLKEAVDANIASYVSRKSHPSRFGVLIVS